MSLACVPKENMGDTSLLSFFFFSFCLRFLCWNVLSKKEVLKKMPLVLFFPIIIKSQCILGESAARK